MPEFCSCGAELPPDARFCHKCGKPQFEADFEPVSEPVPVAVTPVLAPVPLTLNFHNPIAVRVGFMMASISALLTSVPYLNLGFVLWWMLAGFFSVYIYRRRTGQSMSVLGGLQMGWITGVLTFAIVTLLFTLTFIPVALSKNGFSALDKQLRQVSPGDPNVEQAVRMLQSPVGVALMLIFFFAMITVLCTAGGALGAKLMGRDARPPDATSV